MATRPLNAQERDFFSVLGDVAFGNAYTPERESLIRRLAPDAPGDLTSDREALARVVAPKLKPFLSQGLAGYGDTDRLLLEPAFLYVTYHRYVPQLDAHIERQAHQGGPPLSVPFGEEAIAELVRSGFSEERATRFFAFFFQLRRAFYFIGHSL